MFEVVVVNGVLVDCVVGGWVVDELVISLMVVKSPKPGDVEDVVTSMVDVVSDVVVFGVS